MKRVSLVVVAVVVVGIIAGSSIAARPGPVAESELFDIVPVANGVYAAISKPGGSAGGNSGFIVGDAGVMVVDTFYTPSALEELLKEIEARVHKPVIYAVNTHYHADHTGGNQVLAARGVPIIAQDNVRKWVTTRNAKFVSPDALKKRRDDTEKALAEIPADQKDKRLPLERRLKLLDSLLEVHFTPPSITFPSGEMHVYLGNREVVLFTLPGHTGGDTLVYVPDADAMFAGDMCWNHTLPNLVDATVVDWIASLDKVLSHHTSTKVVPGHGPVGGMGELREFHDYLVDLHARVKQGIGDGLTLEQAKEKLLLPDKYKSFAFQNFAQPNVEDMYKELKRTKEYK